MANSSRPYQSRLFNFINRQSLQWRDRLGVTFRHLKVAATWSVQALVAPLYWLLHPQEWLGPKLGPVTTTAALPYQSDPPVDQPLQESLATIQAWLGLEPSSSEPDARPSPQIVLPGHFFDHIRQQLADRTLATGDPGEMGIPLALPASPLGRLGQHFKQVFGQSQSKTIIIQGLACQWRSRQLVLVTTDNEVLDVLSPSQQQTLSTAIRRILANFYYQRRVQWALVQQSLGIIPLTNAQATAPLAPLDWFWQGLRWWERYISHHPPLATALTLSPPHPLVRPTPPQPLPARPHATVLAQQVQNRWHGLAGQIQPWLTLSSPALPPAAVDPFQIRIILQAAIDYFFGAGQRPPGLPPKSSGAAEAWLAWDDLFAESPSPELLTTAGGALSVASSSATDLLPSPAVSAGQPMASAPAPTLEWAQLPDLWAEAVPAPTALPGPSAVLAWNNPWQTELETAFDWIETEARPAGYQRHLLEYLLAGLDQLVFWLEVTTQRLGEWLQARFWPWLKALMTERHRA